MKTRLPIPIRTNSPWVNGFLLPVDGTETELARLIRRLEGDDERGMFRAVPLTDAAYIAVMQSALEEWKAIGGARIEDGGRAILVDAAGDRRALRLVRKLQN